MGIVIAIIVAVIILHKLSLVVGVTRWLAIIVVITLIIFNYDSYFVQQILPVGVYIFAMIVAFFIIPDTIKEYGGYKLAYQYLLIKLRPTFTDNQLINQSRRISEIKDIINTTKEKELSTYYENRFKEFSNDFIELKSLITTLLDTYIKQDFAQITFKKPKHKEFMEKIECSIYSFQVYSLAVKSKNKESILEISMVFDLKDFEYYMGEYWLTCEEDFKPMDSDCIKDVSKQAKKCFIKYVKKNPHEFL